MLTLGLERNIYVRLTSAYFPNMNELVEQAFGSISALTRCIFMRLPVARILKKAFNHAVFIRNIMPNQTIDGYVK